jgi:hypothetical protein
VFPIQPAGFKVLDIKSYSNTQINFKKVILNIEKITFKINFNSLVERHHLLSTNEGFFGLVFLFYFVLKQSFAM